MPLCQVAGGELFYAEKGQGEPLLFLSGLSGDHLYWAGQLRAFGKCYHCLALDNRDVGQSAYAAAPYTVADLAADVAGLLDRLHLPPAHVVGLSMGGMIAQELALLAPERVKSLALVSSLARSDAWFRGTLEAFALIRKQVADTAAFFDAILPWWVGYRFFEQGERAAWLRWLLRQCPHPQRPDGFLRQLDAAARHDALGRLAAIGCPVLVLVGEDDCVAPPRYSTQLQAALPQARLVTMPGVGHAPPIEDAAQFNGQLADFLESQGLRSPPWRRTG
jgi:pimeloyl-ACP methyl ester carboxylesterase